MTICSYSPTSNAFAGIASSKGLLCLVHGTSFTARRVTKGIAMAERIIPTRGMGFMSLGTD
jgi:hypothetical protein